MSFCLRNIQYLHWEESTVSRWDCFAGTTVCRCLVLLCCLSGTMFGISSNPTPLWPIQSIAVCRSQCTVSLHVLRSACRTSESPVYKGHNFLALNSLAVMDRYRCNEYSALMRTKSPKQQCVHALSTCATSALCWYWDGFALSKLQ